MTQSEKNQLQSKMKKKIVMAGTGFLLVFALLSASRFGSAAGDASAPGADSCTPPKVDIFDLSIPPNPVPAGTTVTDRSPQAEAYMHWQDLTTAYGGVSEALINKDPSRNGIQYLDATIANAASGKTVTNYNPGFDTAPTGAINGVDYMVTGSITGSEGAYTVSVALQDATTRAQIATGQETFSSSRDSMTAAQTAASQLTPVLGKIRAYQRKLRQQSDDMAIGPPDDQPEVTPAKRSLTHGQSTKVTLSLRDCDGMPLAHRTLKLKATHGRISPASVQTDAGGQAHATFTAMSRGIAMIQADYGPYETVTHKHDQRRGSAAIAVKTSGIWEFKIDARWQDMSSTTWALGINSEKDHSSKQASVHALELIQSNTPDPLTNSNAQGWNVIGGQAQASASESETMLEVLHIPNGGTTRTTKSFDGSVADGLPGLDIFHGNPLDLKFEFSVKGISHFTFHRSVFDEPADQTEPDRFTYTMQNSAGWKGSCSRQGNVKNGYTIICNVSSDSGDDLIHNAATPKAGITAFLHIIMTPL